MIFKINIIKSISAQVHLLLIRGGGGAVPWGGVNREGPGIRDTQTCRGGIPLSG